MRYTINIKGRRLPVHFGIWGLKRISEELSINTTNLLEAINVTAIGDQINLAKIGLQEGQKFSARNFNTAIDEEVMTLDEEGMAALLDEDPDVLEKIYAVYVEQCYGKKLQQLIDEADKVDKEAADNLRKLVGSLVTEQTAPSYLSPESKK
jgi:hypothetical protein